MNDSARGCGHRERVFVPRVQNIPSDQCAPNIRPGCESRRQLREEWSGASCRFAAQQQNWQRGRARDGVVPVAIWQLQPHIPAAVSQRGRNTRDACQCFTGLHDAIAFVGFRDGQRLEKHRQAQRIGLRNCLRTRQHGLERPGLVIGDAQQQLHSIQPPGFASRWRRSGDGIVQFPRGSCQTTAIEAGDQYLAVQQRSASRFAHKAVDGEQILQNIHRRHEAVDVLAD